MENLTPCSDYVETSGIVFFARMLDKIRLHAQGQLPDGYNLGFSDSTSFDARFCRFWEIDYDQLVPKPLKADLTRNCSSGVFEEESGLIKSRSWFGILLLSNVVGGTLARPG